MDRNMNRSHWSNRQGGSIKGNRPPRLTPSDNVHSHHHHHHSSGHSLHPSHNPHSPSSSAPPPATTPPAPSTPHDDLINYIYESWDKLSREASVWSEPSHISPSQRPTLQSSNLDSCYGRRDHINNHPHNHTHTIKHNS